MFGPIACVDSRQSCGSIPGDGVCVNPVQMEALDTLVRDHASISLHYDPSQHAPLVDAAQALSALLGATRQQSASPPAEVALLSIPTAEASAAALPAGTTPTGTAKLPLPEPATLVEKVPACKVRKCAHALTGVWRMRREHMRVMHCE